ncbi:tRNA pseudouridine(55) synthase TruB [Microbacterium sp.]|uniref:tRNA pseudouridine(55) synthase TruB n=1 Tax=Microbacterium sp. TaxID=51671 RepID=UPI0039E59E4A
MSVSTPGERSAPRGIALVDKPGGMTSHDVVVRARRALDIRKIGHAGTLDPMATGLLVLGVGSATRLLTFIVGLDKTYEATIRLGVSTDSDDADGVETARASADEVAAVTEQAIATGVATLTGRISQVPSRVSAIKVGGKRAYDLARAGQDVELAPREVTVSRFAVARVRRDADAGTIDLDVSVDCSSGTYIRALARDLGAHAGVGGHLTALRRTRIGPFEVAGAATDVTADLPLLDEADVARRVLGALEVSSDEARDLRHGKRLLGAAERIPGPISAAIDPAGRLVGIVQRRGSDLKSVMNLPEEAG